MKSKSDPESGTDTVAEKKTSWFRQSFNPFRIATLRGLAVVLPPVLTIMLFAWAWNTIDRTVLRPVESLSESCVAWAIEDIRPNDTIQAEINRNPQNRLNLKNVDERLVYTAEDGIMLVLVNNQWMPQPIFAIVNNNRGDAVLNSAHDFYKRYVQIRYLKRHLMIPALMAIFLAVMYLLGKLLAAGIGRILWHAIESLIDRLPIIRNVYSSVKQVTDFAFSETDVQFTRVVAVEYPRKGIWSIGFVTGESFLELRQAVGEPMLSVLMPTSPMPATGFTIAVPKSETIDLNITIDQAIQYCVSCGVVVPDHQNSRSALMREIRRRAGQSPLPALESKPIEKPNDNEADPEKE
jgi:uncharacterized membrane protein